jgi:hypothetical protein
MIQRTLCTCATANNLLYPWCLHACALLLDQRAALFSAAMGSNGVAEQLGQADDRQAEMSLDGGSQSPLH